MPGLHLVTGGAGFIGSALVRRLAASGERVRVLDDFSSGRRGNLEGLAAVELFEGDVRDPSILARAMAGASVVFHEAAIASVPLSVVDPVRTHDVNVTGTLQVLVAARDAKVKRVVYAASSSAYGNGPELPKRETMAPEPASPYATAKLAGELYCQMFAEVYGLETVCLRYFNVFGPRQDPLSQYAAVVPRFVTAALAGQEVAIFGDGEQSRDFCFIDDVVAANLLAAEAATVSGRVFNVASGRPLTLNAVLLELEGILGRRIERRHEAERAGDVRHSVADIGAARRVLGFVPTTSFVEGLARTVDWYRGPRR